VKFPSPLALAAMKLCTFWLFLFSIYYFLKSIKVSARDDAKRIYGSILHAESLRNWWQIENSKVSENFPRLLIEIGFY
jgi:hypothetical protein